MKFANDGNLNYSRSETVHARQVGATQHVARAGGQTTGAWLYPGFIGRFFRGMTRQTPAFWALQLYLFLEYFRPQQIYEVLSFFPWSIVTLTIACLLFLTESRRRGHFLPTDWLLLAFTVVVLASSVAAIDPQLSIQKMDLYILWVPLYVLVSRLATTEERVILMIGAWILWNAKMAMSGAISWVSCGLCYRGWGIVGTPGPFNEASDFAIEMVIVFCVSTWFLYGLWPRLSWPRRFLLGAVPFTSLLCVLGANTRGSLLGLAVAILVMVLSSEKRGRMLGVAFLVAIAVAIFLPKESFDRFNSAGDDETSQSRLTYWRRGIEMANERPALGIGFANWLPYYRARYREKGHVQHNIFIQALSETGYLGLTAFTMLVVAVFVVNYRTRRVLRDFKERTRVLRSLSRGYDAALAGYLVAGFFLTVLYYPFFWVTMSFVVATYFAAVNERKRLAAGGMLPAVGLAPGRSARMPFPARRSLASVSTRAFGPSWR